LILQKIEGEVSQLKNAISEIADRPGMFDMDEDHEHFEHLDPDLHHRNRFSDAYSRMSIELGESG